MTLLPTEPPDELREHADSLFQAVGSCNKIRSMIGAVPRFIAPVSQLSNRQPIGKAAEPAGWRFIRISERHSEQIDFASDDWDCWIFAATTSARMLAEHARNVEDQLRDNAEAYWPRILSLPEVQMEAFWVHSPKRRVRDRYFSLPKGQVRFLDRRFTTVARQRARKLPKPTQYQSI